MESFAGEKPGDPNLIERLVVDAPPLRVDAYVGDCAEYNRLVAEHLKAITEWKKSFDDADAWEWALKAEVEVLKHTQRHKCQIRPAEADEFGTTQQS